MAQLGVQMFTLRKYTQNTDDLDKALKRVADIGYRVIQVSAFGDIAPETTAELCARYGLTIGGTHVGWDRFRNDLEAVIDEHKLWNCRHTAVGMIPPDTYLSLAGLEQFVEELQPVLKGLSAASMTFSYHNHAHEFFHFEGVPWLQAALESPAAAQMCFELDTHWIVAGGADPVQWIHKVGDRQPLLHLKDFRLSDEYKRRFAAIGDGNLNWAQYPIDYYLIEQDSCYGEDEFLCLERSYRFLAEQGLT